MSTPQYPLRRLLRELEILRTSDVPLIRWHHTVCLVTVILGGKPACALGFDEPVPGKVRAFLEERSSGLGVCIQETVRPPRDPAAVAGVPPRIAEAIGSRWDRSRPSNPSILWVTRSRNTEDRIAQAVLGRLSVGEVLGYPPCCVEAYRSDLARMLTTYCRRLREEAGTDSEAAILELVCRNDPVTGALPGADRAMRTLSRFPFVPFIACALCLDGRSSAADELNLRYRAAMETVDPAFARSIMLVAEAMAMAGSSPGNPPAPQAGR